MRAISQLLRLYSWFLAIMVAAAKIEVYWSDQTDGVKKQCLMSFAGDSGHWGKIAIYASSKLHTHTHIHTHTYPRILDTTYTHVYI